MEEIPPTDPFGSAKRLVAEAHEHLAELTSLWRGFARSAHCAPVTYEDEKLGQTRVKVAVRQGLSVGFRTLAFDVAYKIRRALDQAAIAGAVLLGKEERSGGFPFGPDARAFEQSVKNSCAGYDAELVAHLRALEPHGDGDDLLAALGEMANSRRKQITLDIAVDASRVAIENLVPGFTGPGEAGCLGWDKKKRELHIATVIGTDTKVVTAIDDRTRLPLYLESGGSPAFVGREALALLKGLIGKVERIVLGIEAETTRIMAARPALA